MKKMALLSFLLLAACDGDWEFCAGACDKEPIKYEYRNICHLNLEAIGYKQLGYFEGNEAKLYLAPINIRLDHRNEPTINLDVFTLWVNKETQIALISTGCRVIELDYVEALKALVK